MLSSGPPPDAFAFMRVMGFDYGMARIGVAVGNRLTGTSTGIATVSAQPTEAMFAHIQTLIQEWQPEALVVGLPWHTDGSASKLTALCQSFAEQLQKRSGLPYFLVDERYTSKAAESNLMASSMQHHAPNPERAAARGQKPRYKMGPSSAKGSSMKHHKGGGANGLDAVSACLIIEQFFLEGR